jgi:hypothetical protein
MSFTWSLAPVSVAGNQTNGMPRRSAYRIWRPYFCALGATSQEMPRLRSLSATRSLTGRLSSSARATSTALGTARLPASTPSEMSGTSVRERPNEIPTPGYVVRPSEARASYRPPPPTALSRS